MEVVRKIVSAELLAPIIDLPWASKGMQVEVIVKPQIKKAPKREEVTVDSLEGCLREYANPALREREKHAWEENVMEKYGHI
jgi:hypothetical protein